MSIKIIGLTGPSGAGKSFVSAHLAKKGIPVIDADAVYHSLLTKNSDCTSALVNEFGTQILNENGEPDTKKLGTIVFTSEEKLKKLNCLVLGFVITKIKELISELEKAKHTAVVLDAPTLIESGFSCECDCVISILADKEQRIKRICTRDNITEEKASMRTSAQKADEFYMSNSDYVISNDGNENELMSRVDKLFSEILDY